MSVTLFAIKINSLAAMIPQQILTSLFVDDLQIACSDHSIDNINNKLQQTIDAISNWTIKNGFRVSISKTVSITFFKNFKPALKPDLKINARKIPAVESTKFLGLHWDEKLRWNVHIDSAERKVYEVTELNADTIGTALGS